MKGINNVTVVTCTAKDRATDRLMGNDRATDKLTGTGKDRATDRLTGTGEDRATDRPGERKRTEQQTG